MNKYEQLIEYIINDEEDKARELFHNIVVEQGTKIYESLVNEDESEEELDEVSEVEGLVDEITLDEQGITEEDEEGMDDLADLDHDEHEEEASEEELEPRVDALEDAIDELKAEFDALMAGEEQEPEHADMFGAEEENELAEAQCSEDEDEDMEEDMDESIVREYVEKVGTPANAEGAAVGAGKSVAVNKKSTVAGKNDMGGTAVDVTKGGHVDPNGQKPEVHAKPHGDLIGKNHATPGANAGKAFATKEAAKAGEGETTHGKVPVNAKSPVAK